MSEYQHVYTKFILADVEQGVLNLEMVQAIQRTFASEPERDAEYLASLNEALSILLNLNDAMTHLLDAEEVMKRMRDRTPPWPEGEVE